MYYDYNTNSENVDLSLLKQLPQFIGMSDDDIKTFIHKIDRIEKAQWIKEWKTTTEKRDEDVAYTIHLSKNEVKIDCGVKIARFGDANGFVTDEVLDKQRRQFRLSLENKPSLYIPYMP